MLCRHKSPSFLIVMQSKYFNFNGSYSWCGPCKKLTPALEQITINNDSRFKLVKVNIDKLPQIANGLKVQSIPAVFLIYGGKVTDSFVGIPEPDRLQDFFNKAVILQQISTDPKVQEALVQKSEDLLKADDLDQAFGILFDLYQYEQLR